MSKTTAFRAHSFRIVEREEIRSPDERLSTPGIEETKVRVKFSHGPDRGPERLAWSLLIDDDNRREVHNLIYVRPGNLWEHGAFKCAERLNKLPTCLKADGIKHKRRFSTSGYSGKDHDLVFWN